MPTTDTDNEPDAELELEAEPSTNGASTSDPELEQIIAERVASPAAYYVNVTAPTVDQMRTIERALGVDYFEAIFPLTQGRASRVAMEAVVRCGRMTLDGEAKEALKLPEGWTLADLIDRFNLCQYGWEERESDPQ